MVKVANSKNPDWWFKEIGVYFSCIMRNPEVGDYWHRLSSLTAAGLMSLFSCPSPHGSKMVAVAPASCPCFEAGKEGRG